jgi:signal transduction histidine kinase
MMHIELVQLGKPVANWVDMFGQQVKRLVDISKRLMNFARNVSDEYPMEDVSVNKAVEDIVAIVKNEFCNDSIEINLSLKDDLPAIVGNANSLQQVFLNLLINSRDAMPKGGVIAVSTEVQEGFVVTRFSDTGVGVEQENLEKIFSPFFTTKGAGKGTGLGLAICNKIVGQHGGTISVESQVNQGTVFTIRLPLRRTKE